MRIIVSLLFVASCIGTRPNPADCADGSCNDPALPFCDRGGELMGQANTCIAVDCTPGQIAACRDDELVRCNADGTNYDVVVCERGCDGLTGCIECSASEQCGNPSPVCDSDSHRCRACAVDDECSSLVCDFGSCADESQVVYATPNGGGTACSQSSPCSASGASIKAKMASNPPFVRLLPGVYDVPNTTGQFGVAGPTSGRVRFVATGATILGSSGAIFVSDGANVSLRGGTISGRITCGATDPVNPIPSSLELVEVNLAPSNLSIDDCTVTLDKCDVDNRTIAFFDNATLRADRTRFHATAAFPIPLGQGSTLRITNSELRNVLVDAVNASNPTVELAFNTIVLTLQDQYVECRSTEVPVGMKYENNIIVTEKPPIPFGGNAVVGTGCSMKNNILFPQPTPIVTNIIADPLFVDAAAKDFHLQPTSPARDAATPTTIMTDHDFEGTPRPQGATLDIGAFELTP